MKMDEEDGAGKKADPRVRGFLSDRDTRTVNRRGGCLRIEAAPVFACICVRACVSTRVEEKRELTLAGRWPNEASPVLLKSHSLPVVARRHRVSTVIEKGDATRGRGLQRLRPFVVTYAVTERTWIVCKLRSRTRGEPR